jgi:glycine cleavage system H protein
MNRDPYDTGWLVVIEMDNLDQLEDLFVAANYHDFIMQEESY